MAKVISIDEQRKKNSPKVDLKKHGKSPLKDYSPQLIQLIEDFFKAQEWKHKPVDKYNTIRTGFSVDCKFRTVEAVINIEPQGLILHFIMPVGAGTDKEDQRRVMEFLARANYGLRRLCFEMDLKDGEIDLRASIFFSDGKLPSFNALDDLFARCTSITEIYGDAMIKVIYDIATPEEAINEAEAD